MTSVYGGGEEDLIAAWLVARAPAVDPDDAQHARLVHCKSAYVTECAGVGGRYRVYRHGRSPFFYAILRGGDHNSTTTELVAGEVESISIGPARDVGRECGKRGGPHASVTYVGKE